MNLKKIRTIFFAAAFSMLSFTNVYAASYTIKPYDSLYKIGLLFKTTPDTIMKNNNLATSQIYPNQVLKIDSKTYTVQPSDTFYLIAKKYNISIDALIAANNTARYIYPGQILNIPGGIVFKGTSSTKSPIVPYTQSDLDLLARLVTAETETEPYTAKVAVAAVVLNRVKSSQFPSTIKDVIYEKSSGYYQFTPVSNGWINKTASADSKKAALEALYGSDPTKGAIYYFDDSATNKWLWSRPLALKVGKMIFTY